MADRRTRKRRRTLKLTLFREDTMEWFGGRAPGSTEELDCQAVIGTDRMHPDVIAELENGEKVELDDVGRPTYWEDDTDCDPGIFYWRLAKPGDENEAALNGDKPWRIRPRMSYYTRPGSRGRN